MTGEAPLQSALEQFTVDLTAAARAGELDPVFGRDAEIRQVIDVLLRRRQNNPLLVGEPGVGKTAIVEGLAAYIVNNRVPPLLQQATIRSLDIGLLLAGAAVRGEFESRLKAVTKEIETSLRTVILFIDEAHTLIGSGGQADAANLLKPALARGSFKTIAATTRSEYRKYFEKDPAFARRFQVVAVEEPTETQAIQMLRPLVPLLERHHGVYVTDEAICAAVRLSHRYVTGRQLPDKAVSVLDTSCARVATAQKCTPMAVEICQRRVAELEEDIRILQREQVIGAGRQEQLTRIFDQLAAAEMQLADLEDRWREERSLVEQLLKLRALIEVHLEKEDIQELRVKFQETAAKLKSVAGESPLVPAFVDDRVTAEMISEQTGIPIGRMVQNEIQNVLNLRSLLAERIVGQPHAIETVARQLFNARAGIEDPKRPMGVFLLVGPSGVGKTETGLALADLLYGGERNAVVLNMSEYQEAHSVSTLKGAPPGYVGYGEGGVLTEAIRRRPYCVVLLDEIDKAHPDVLELFCQVFDKGWLEDAQGRPINFRNTLILMTSNVGADSIRNLCQNEQRQPEADHVVRVLATELMAAFRSAFLDRLTVIPYYPLQESSLRHIAELKIERLRARLLDSKQIQLEYSEELVAEIARRATSLGGGARPIDKILNGTIMPEVSAVILNALASQRCVQQISLGVGPDRSFRYYSR